MGRNSGNDNFRQMEIYKEARKLNNVIYRMTNLDKFKRDFSLIDQMRRAVRSIMFNFAEGFEKGTNKEKIRYMYIAKGSCGEIRAQIDVAIDQDYITTKLYDEIEDKCVYIGSMISSYIKYLRRKDSGNKR